jgi:hypothetical protein
MVFNQQLGWAGGSRMASHIADALVGQLEGWDEPRSSLGLQVSPCDLSRRIVSPAPNPNVSRIS